MDEVTKALLFIRFYQARIDALTKEQSEFFDLFIRTACRFKQECSTGIFCENPKAYKGPLANFCARLDCNLNNCVLKFEEIL